MNKAEQLAKEINKTIERAKNKLEKMDASTWMPYCAQVIFDLQDLKEIIAGWQANASPRWVKASENPKKQGYYNGRCGTAKVPCVLWFSHKDKWYNEDVEEIINISMYEWLEEQPAGEPTAESKKEPATVKEHLINEAEKKFKELRNGITPVKGEQIKVGDTVKSKHDVFSDEEYDKSGAKNLGKETYVVDKVEYWPQGEGNIVYGKKSDKRNCEVWHHEEDLKIVTPVKGDDALAETRDALSEMIRSMSRIKNSFPDQWFQYNTERLEKAQKILAKYAEPRTQKIVRSEPTTTPVKDWKENELSKVYEKMQSDMNRLTELEEKVKEYERRENAALKLAASNWVDNTTPVKGEGKSKEEILKKNISKWADISQPILLTSEKIFLIMEEYANQKGAFTLDDMLDCWGGGESWQFWLQNRLDDDMPQN